MVLALLNGEGLPETFQFLHAGWWATHVVGIAVVLYIGYLMGRKKASSLVGERNS